MTKYFCDRCQRDFEEDKNIYQIKLLVPDKYCKILSQCKPKTIDICLACTMELCNFLNIEWNKN